MCMGILPVHLYVNVADVCTVHGSQKRALDSLKLLVVMWKLTTKPGFPSRASKCPYLLSHLSSPSFYIV